MSKDGAPTLVSKCVMELIGTAMLCFAVGTAAGQGADLTPLAVGGTLMCIVYFGAHISGGQYNPAVALSIFLRGKMSLLELGAYVLSQIVGGFLGGLIAMACTSSNGTFNNIGYPDIPNNKYGSAIVGEIVMTFALCHVILHVATTAAQVNNSYYGLAIGFTVLAGAVGVGPYSGGAFNPAVGIALPILRGDFDSFWVYILGPLIGASLASLLFAFTHANELPGTGPLRALKTAFADSPVRKLGAPIAIEFVGTGLLAFSIATSAAPTNPNRDLAALAIGSTLMCQVYAGGATSGGQYNPAVTLGITIRKMLATWSVDTAGAQLKNEVTNVKTIAYIVVQVIGALVGALLGLLVVDGAIGCPNPPTLQGTEFVAEIVGTFFLVFVVLQAATSSKTTDNDFFGLAIGFVVASMAVAVGGVSGGAFNPAIGLMTLLHNSNQDIINIWIYWVACPIGGILAALLFRVTNAPEFVKAQDEAKTEILVAKNNTVFADAKEGPRVSNVLFANPRASQAGVGQSVTVEKKGETRTGDDNI